YWWVILPAHLLWCVQALLVPELDFWMNLAPALGWTAGLAMIEWHYDGDRFVASLPVTRASIVTARYVSGLSVVFVGAALYAAYGHAAAAVAGQRLLARWPGTPAWAAADGVAAFLLVGYAILVGFLPFFFRFGLPLGTGLFAVSAAAVLTVAGLFSSLVSTPGVSIARSGLAHLPSGMVRAWLASLSAQWGTAPAAFVIIAGAAACGLVSLRLSVRSYERRDL
ncbi:MAG: ABC-2 transporter permease, partial [Bacteroidales bacterium]